MTSFRAPGGGWLPWGVVAVGWLGLVVALRAGEVPTHLPEPPTKPAVGACEVREVRSRHFLIHTDLSRMRASSWWTGWRPCSNGSRLLGRPVRGVIECYVVRDLERFPTADMEPAGVRAIRDRAV